MMPKGELLFETVAHFPPITGADELMRIIKVPSLAHFDNGYVELSVRNASSDASCGTLAIDVGHMRKFRPYPKEVRAMVCMASNAGESFSRLDGRPHGLKLGDRVYFKVGGAGGDASMSLTASYWVIDYLGTFSDFVFSVSAVQGGGAIKTTDADEEVICTYLATPIDGVVSAVFDDADNIADTAVPHGLSIGDAVTVKVAAGNLVAGTVYYVLTVPTLTSFTVSASQGGATFDACPAAADITAALFMAEEFVSLTTFSVPVAAAATYLVNNPANVSKIIQGFAAAPTGGVICISPAAKDAAPEWTVAIQIRRA
jgi:hypothetical protein